MESKTLIIIRPGTSLEEPSVDPGNQGCTEDS